MSEERDGFLSRWSRLKREGVPVSRTEAGPVSVPAATPEEAALPDGKSLEELIAGLPRVEELAPGQSLTAFMQGWVPNAIRNAALQRMWLLDPAIRDYVNPALDYAYDYNTPGAAPGFGTMETSEEAVREVAEMFDRALGRKGPESPQEGAGECGDDVSQRAAEPPALDGATQRALQPAAGVAAAAQPGSTAAGRISGPVTQQPGKENAALQNNLDADKSPRAAGSRHGGALPS